jgi:O-antigen/teichoic acid export membrane protein
LKVIFKNILMLSSAEIFAKLIGAVTTFLIAKFLAPSDYGLWISLLLIVSYSGIINLGTMETLLKEYPYHIGRNETDKAHDLENHVFTAVMLSSGVLLLTGLAFQYFLEDIAGPTLMIARMMFVAAAVVNTTAYFQFRFSAHQNFRTLSILTSCRTVFAFSLMVLLTWLWGLAGTVLGYLINEVILFLIAVFLSLHICGKVRFMFDLSKFAHIIRIGFPISIIWWIFIVQLTVDRMISISLLGKTQTGYYGIGVAIVSAVILIPDAISRVLYPKFSERLGKKSDAHEMRDLLFYPAHLLSFAVPLALGVLVIICPFVFRRYLPAYLPGLHAAQILILGSFFLCMIRNGLYFLISLGQQNKLIVYFLFSLAISISASFVLIQHGFNIEGIAFSAGLAGAILTTLIWMSVLKHMEYPLQERWCQLFSLYCPYMVMMVLLFGFIAVEPDFLKMTGPASCVYILLLTAVLLLMIFRVPFFSRIFSIILHKVKNELFFRLPDELKANK